MDSSRQKAEKLWGSSRETIHEQRSIFDCFSSKISKEGVWKARKWVWLLGWRQRRACATLPSAYSPLWWGGLSCVMWPEASWKVRCSTPVDPVDPEICPVILKMENIFLLMNSIIHLWKIPCSMSIVVDISFAIMCGVGALLPTNTIPEGVSRVTTTRERKEHPKGEKSPDWNTMEE